MDKVMDRLADERIAGESRAEKLIAIDDDTARGSEPIRGPGIIETGQGTAYGKDRRSAGHHRDVDSRIGRSQMRIAAEIVIVEDEMIHRVAVVAAEPVAPVIAAFA